jgi:hypothetical protein
MSPGTDPVEADASGTRSDARFQLLAKYALGELDRAGLAREARRLVPLLREQEAHARRQYDATLAELTPPQVPPLRPSRLPKVRDNLQKGLAADTDPDSGLVFEDLNWIAQPWQPPAMHAAELYWVAAPMSALVESAMTTLPAEDRHRTLWPSGSGFLVYEAAFQVPQDGTYETRVGGTYPIRALQWAPTADGINIATFADLTKFSDDLADSTADTDPDRKIGDLAGRRQHVGEMSAILQHRMVTRYGCALAPIGWASYSFTNPPQDTAAASLAARLLTTWLLMSQPMLSARTRLPADRDVARAYRRQNRPVPDVTLIDLRHVKTPADPDAEHATRTYSHRWVVRGHWRNQAYGPGRSLRRPLFIPSYVKGPDEAPLKLSEHVNVWRR